MNQFKHLSDDEMQEFTGTESTQKQKNMLKQYRIPFIVKCDKKVTTTWYVINQSLLDANPSDEPDFSSLA